RPHLVLRGAGPDRDPPGGRPPRRTGGPVARGRREARRSAPAPCAARKNPARRGRGLVPEPVRMARPRPAVRVLLRVAPRTPVPHRRRAGPDRLVGALEDRAPAARGGLAPAGARARAARGGGLGRAPDPRLLLRPGPGLAALHRDARGGRSALPGARP